MELFNESENLQTFSQSQGFRPETAPDIAASIEREYNAYQNQLRFYEQSRSTNQSTKLANARREGEDLIALGQFSATAAKLGDAVVKKLNEQSEISDTYNALFGETGAPEIQDEDEILTEGEAQAEEVAGIAQRAEQQGGVDAGEVVRQRLGGLGQAATGDRTRAIQASTNYGAYLTAYLDSDATISVNGTAIPIRSAARSANPALRMAAMAQARQQFIKDFDLRSVSRRNLVRYLAPQVINSEASVGSALANQGTKERRAEEIQRVTGLAYEVGRTQLNTSTAQTNYEEIATQFYVSNTGLSRGQANEAAVKALIAGAVSTGNPDAIEALRGVKYNPNGGDEPSNTLGGRFGALIDQGIAEAKSGRKARQGAIKEELTANMWAQLAGVQDEAARGTIVENTALQLEASGLFQAAEDLRNDWDELSTPGGVERNEAIVADQIRSGSITSVSQLEEMRRRNEISRDGLKELTGLLSTESTSANPKDPSGKSIADDWKGRFSSTFTQAAGLKRDAYGNVVDTRRGERVLVGSGTARLIIGAAQRDINRAVNEFLQQNPGLNEGQKQAGIQRVLNDWWKDNVQTKGGKYYLQDILEQRAGTSRNRGKYSQEQRDRFATLVTDPDKISGFSAGSRQIVAQDFTSVINPGGDISTSDRQNFNPLRGDKVFSQLEIESAATDYSEGGVLNSDLIKTAQQLGMTPLAFLQQQLGAYGLKPVTVRTPGSPGGAGQVPSSASNASTGVEAAQALMAMGMPVRGAAMLAGNVEAESAMRGQRPYWVLDDGAGRNGGLLSWNRERLTAIEARFGRPVQQISNVEQLQYMMEEMKAKYPQAYRVFMSPYSTDRQLRNAAFRYIGWGIEGDRFINSNRIYSQLGGNS